jgi:hypothetical protein
MNPAISDNADRTSLGEPNVPQVYGVSISTPSFLSNLKSGKDISYPLIQNICGLVQYLICILAFH